MSVWALIPARGGSKSIPRKNLALIAGVPMLDYGLRAAQAAGCFERIVCSTDNDEIATHAERLGATVDRRPAQLAGDETPVAEVAREYLGRIPESERPQILALVQPTSPFLLPEHCKKLVDAILADPAAKSGQTITPVIHNHHYFNQRAVDGPYVAFRFKERASAYNKQKKPPSFVFGNLVTARTKWLLDGFDFFAAPSIGLEIPRHYDLDVDTPADLDLANALVLTKMVELPHMQASVRSPRPSRPQARSL